MELKKEKTHRGFPYYSFLDRYETKCIIQESSLATEAAIWFGVDDAPVKIMKRDAQSLGLPVEGPIEGWMEYPLPEEVCIHDRMHLTQDQVRDLLPILQKFAEEGEI